MLNVPRRRVKRVTILAKRSQLAKKNLYKKRSYKPLYKKLKANNNALAKALSKEKQECQFLFSEKIGLTSEVQELKIACNKRDDVISGALKNAKETLQLLITMSNCVTNTIASCQQIVATTRYTPRKSIANDRRESSSARRLSGKSPARGVVQPMVSGHTITKPTINLSRLNLRREYRVQNPPNLSDIEESLTPEASPAVPVRTSPVRIPITRRLNYGATRVNRLPERLQNSMRVSDESERRSSVRSNRNSGRHSDRRSRENSERLSLPAASRRGSQVIADTHSEECLRSPRVSLHDVSRLLHNSQSVNIRTLLDNSSDMDITQTPQHSEVPLNETSTENESQEIIPETSEGAATDPNVTESFVDPSDSQCSDKKSRNSSLNDTEDPLEGPSWLLNSSQAVSPSSENEISTTTKNSTSLQNTKDQSKYNRTCESEVSPAFAEETQTPSFVNSRSRKQRSNDKNNDEIDEDDDEQTVNLATRWANQPSNFFRNLMNNNADDDDNATTNLSRFVNQKRGSTCEDDDFTMMMRPDNRRKKQHFDINDLNDLQLPVLESPLVATAQPAIPEPEQTTNILRIQTTQHFGNFTLDLPRANGDETIFNHSGLMLPIIGENPDSARPSTVVEQESDEEEDARIDKRKRKRVYKRIINPVDCTSEFEAASPQNPDSARQTTIVEQESDEEKATGDKRKRKRTFKRRVFPPDSPSDTEWAPTPKRKIVKQKRKAPRAKDPSSAKVVLQKLNDTQVKKRSPSPDLRGSQEFDNRRRMPRDASSDSDGSSNASVTNKIVSSRPRRQKAPINLQEPSLGKKMRRN